MNRKQLNVAMVYAMLEKAMVDCAYAEEQDFFFTEKEPSKNLFFHQNLDTIPSDKVPHVSDKLFYAEDGNNLHFAFDKPADLELYQDLCDKVRDFINECLDETLVHVDTDLAHEYEMDNAMSEVRF